MGNLQAAHILGLSLRWLFRPLLRRSLSLVRQGTKEMLGEPHRDRLQPFHYRTRPPHALPCPSWGMRPSPSSSQSGSGRSWLPLLHGRSRESGTAFAETTVCGRSCPEKTAQDRLQAIRRPLWKLIRRFRTTGESQYELFHLSSDPREQRNVVAYYPKVESVRLPAPGCPRGIL